jgi:hypothetical protein
MEPSVDSLLLADWAEIVNGKLYLMGGGFSAIQMAAFDQPHRCALAGALRVPWEHTNRVLDFAAHLETIDGETLDCWSLQGELEAGRAPGQRGEDSITMLATPVEIKVDGPVDLVLRFRFAEDVRSLRFKVLAGPPVEHEA